MQGKKKKHEGKITQMIGRDMDNIKDQTATWTSIEFRYTTNMMCAARLFE